MPIASHLKPVALLGNGSLHVMVNGAGSGFTRCNDVAVSRWREDACFGGGGSFLFLHDDSSSDYAWPAITRLGPQGGSFLFGKGQASFASVTHQIEVETTIAVAKEDDVELRRYRITNRAAHRRTISATSFAEIVLSPPQADAAHLAFSKLFVETEIHAESDTIFATRRPSKPKDVRSWFFHRAVVHGVDAELTFETSRARFIGRGRSLENAEALHKGARLTGESGPVLDAVAAIRASFVLEPGMSCTLDVFSGMSVSRPECERLAQKMAAEGAGERILRQGSEFRNALLTRIGADETQADLFECLAAAMLYSNAALRADPADISANRLGQSSLWSFGISGDSPIVLLEIGREEDLPMMDQLVQAHAFWAAHGIKAEAMIVAANAALLDSIQQRLAGSVAADLVDKRDGVFARERSAFSEDERILLLSVARVVLDGSKRSIEAHLSEPQTDADDEGQPRRSAPSALQSNLSKFNPDADGLLCFNGHGGFSPDLRKYVIHAAADRMTPAPWVNILANPAFGTLISESGSAFTWSANAHEFRLTTWANDPVGDPNTEAFYIVDQESHHLWSPALLPAGDGGAYVTRHGFGSSSFSHQRHGIESSMRVFVAIDAPVKFSVIKLRNRSDRARLLSVVGYVEWVLGDDRTKTSMQIVTESDCGNGAVFARNSYNSDFADHTAFFDVEGDDRSVCGDRGDFFGNGTLARPEAVSRPQLSGRLGAGLDPCAALRIELQLAPGEEKQVVFRLGAGKTREEASALVDRWRGPQAAEDALAAVETYWRRTLGVVQVHTPDKTVDALANGWLLYQVLSARIWGRTGFYQSSGAYGFRDQLQDVLSLVHAEPALLREHLLRSASRQFPQGDVQHWWHPPSGKGNRTRCSDDYLWLPFVASRYVATTGDQAVFDVECPFIESDPLKDDEESQYGLPKPSEKSATLYDHCVRSIRYGLRYGEHGLPLMGHGDWNDGMDRVGAGGKGESVWLAFFLIAVLKQFAPLARERSDVAFADLCEAEAQKIAGNVEASGWDGAWYRRAYFDDGTPLGSASNSECQIDAIAQSWSVLSGAAPADRARQAMDSVYERLVRKDMRLIQLLDPPFDTSEPSPGYIAGYVPGVRENGGQYTHGVMWTAIAYAALGDADRAWEAFSYLNPINHGSSPADIEVYKVEPYVVAGDVYTAQPHAGRGGWTWYTGAAGWMYQLLVEHLLGLQRRQDRLRIRPMLPRDWRGFEMNYRFGNSTYAISCREAAPGKAAGVSIDGVDMPEDTILLQDDGSTHVVVVDIRRSSPDST